MSKKEAGVLLHISSLPGRFGIGTFGKDAYKFVDFLAECGFKYWELLPLEDIGNGNSPFDILSAYSTNYLFIDFDELIKDGLLTSRDLTGKVFGSNPRKVDYSLIKPLKIEILKTAFKRFDRTNPRFIRMKNSRFRFEYALFQTIRQHNNNAAWFDFKLEERYFDKELKEEYIKKYSDEIDFYIFITYIFHKQYFNLKQYANSKGIEIIGEVPHFVGYNSDSMYMNPELFMIDKRNIPTYVVGFPPDSFRKDGQKWGYPLYDWEYMKINNYKWWRHRLDTAHMFYDRIKLNHFRGFYEVYAVPFKSKNGRKGKYFEGPGLEFINEIKSDYPLIANDLGTYSKDVSEFVEKSGLESLRVLLNNLFEDKFYSEEFLPSNITENTYFYIENHDNLPIKGLLEVLNDEQIEIGKKRVIEEAEKLGLKVNDNLSLFEKTRFIMEIALASRANHVTLTMQDILFQGKNSRMNEPGTVNENNWTYRFLWHDLTEPIKKSLKELLLKYNRSNLTK